MLAQLHPHERDSRITFFEEGHVYTIQGVDGHPISVTTLIHKMFQEFDADSVIDRMMASKKWPTSKYHGMTKQQIKDMWEANRVAASESGTRMHKSIEDFMNSPEEHRTQAMKFFLEHDRQAVPAHLPQTPEFKMFMDFWHEASVVSKCKPFRSEWLVYDADKRLSGSIDMVVQDEEGNFIILDWKRSKEIKKSNPWQSGEGCVRHLPDCNFSHYSLQLNVYRHLLETLYGMKIDDMFIVVLHPDNTAPEVHRIARMEKEIEALMAILPLDVNAKGVTEEHCDE